MKHEIFTNTFWNLSKVSKKIIFLITVIVFFISCEKPEGEGGTSVINGKVIYFTTSYNAQTSSMDTTYYPKAGKDIYIIYSENEDNINDRTKGGEGDGTMEEHRNEGDVIAGHQTLGAQNKYDEDQNDVINSIHSNEEDTKTPQYAMDAVDPANDPVVIGDDDDFYTETAGK